MAIYDASYIGTSTNRVTFNDFTTTPIFRAISRSPQRRDIRELDIPIPFENGISDFETLTGRYAYTIDGVMYPGGESEYDEGLAKLRKLASLEISQDDSFSDDGYVPYVWTEFSRQRQVFVKVLYVQIIEDTRKGLVQPFRLVCKVKDPTIYGVTIKTATTETSDPTTASGSAVLPVTFPVVIGASTYSVSSNANNQGDLSTDPIGITVYGPVNVPKITNTSTGEFIQVNTNLATSSNVLRIAYDKDSLTCEVDGNSVLDKTSGTFFKLRSGVNEITLSGSSIGSGSYVEVSYYDAWPLS
jgi:hypothetical protein